MKAQRTRKRSESAFDDMMVGKTKNGLAILEGRAIERTHALLISSYAI